jgi:hypothetical protein
MDLDVAADLTAELGRESAGFGLPAGRILRVCPNQLLQTLDQPLTVERCGDIRSGMRVALRHYGL